MSILRKIIAEDDRITLSDDPSNDTMAFIVEEKIGEKNISAVAVLDVEQVQELAKVLNIWLRAKYLRDSLR